MKKAIYSIIILTLILVSISQISAVCTVLFDSETYKPSETITATMSCSENGEKNIVYTLNWTNATGSQLEVEIGITPAVAGTPFFEIYVIPSDYSGIINATLQGTGLEGNDSANVSGSNANSLIITDASFTTAAYIGELFSVVFTVTDENDKKIDNANCVVYGTDDIGAPLQLAGGSITKDGRGGASGILDQIHTEGNEYIAVVACSCGVANTSNSCTDEDGFAIGASSGSNIYPYTVSRHLTVNTVTDRSEYIMKNEIVICANVTNVGKSVRIPMHVYYQVRCSAGIDNNYDLDRTLIISDNHEPDMRGISPGTTQMQCKRFVIPESRYLQGRSSQCYASTNTWVLNDLHGEILGYATTSQVFNITSTELNINPDWKRTSEYNWNSIINLSTDNFVNFNGTGIGDIDLKLNMIEDTIDHTKQYGTKYVDLKNFIMTQYIKTITAKNSSGDNINFNLEVLDDGSIEIELKDVDISRTGWANVTIEFNQWNERQSEALEGIENKTGTFHFDVDCPPKAPIGEEMDCAITAFIEETQLVQKEVDFTCYISTDQGRKSESNFNQMVTRTPQTFHRKFQILEDLAPSEQYVLQCEAGYYNFGSRTDSFFDTFLVTDDKKGNEGITAPQVEIEELVDKIVEIIDEIIPGKLPVWANVLIIACLFLLIIFIIILVIVLVKRRKKPND